MTATQLSAPASQNYQASEQFVGPYTAQEPALDSSEHATESGYAAGDVPAYLSDGELLLWLEQKSQQMYGQVREAMGISTERSQLMQELTHLKGLIDSGAPHEAISAKMNELRATYAGTIYEDEIAPLCSDDMQFRMKTVRETEVGGVEVKLDDSLSADIQAEIDKLGRDDQLALIQIQNLMSNIREAGQLASNLIASRDQACNLIIGNVGS